ncbi:MAG TPA: Trm112 family protein [Pyrinomonadaceae bacterium]
MEVTQEVLEMFRFVCPACRGKLVLQEQARRIKCVACRRVYPIDDAGIPNMVAEEATVEDEEAAPQT